MAQLFSNNAVAYLNSSITNSTTTISLQSGQGSKFPDITNSTDYFLLTLYKLTNGIEQNHEIIKVTSKVGDILTVQRGQEGTTARPWASSSPLECRVTANSMRIVSATAIFTTPPKVISTTTYTVLITDISLVFTTINCTVTLPPPANNLGRMLFMRNNNNFSDFGALQENSIVSGASNVLSMIDTTPGINILPASSGKFAILQSDGTNWIVIAGN
jgi:hypothetical protein